MTQLNPSLLQLAFSARIMRNALKVSLVVGTLLNCLNQGEAILAGGAISWFHLVMNYMVPFCVANYSAAKNEKMRTSD
ncbi:MAG: nitrate/nitrite transporter NrtS [Xanthomonadales bacterium]|nr:nitrate/nitrite transporter NrtS [Xanthomonadales bacterium]